MRTHRPGVSRLHWMRCGISTRACVVHHGAAFHCAVLPQMDVWGYGFPRSLAHKVLQYLAHNGNERYNAQVGLNLFRWLPLGQGCHISGLPQVRHEALPNRAIEYRAQWSGQEGCEVPEHPGRDLVGPCRLPGIKTCKLFLNFVQWDDLVIGDVAFSS